LNGQRLHIIGIDPGLQKTGWGIIAVDGNRLGYVGCGVVKTDAGLSLANRLVEIHDGLNEILGRFDIDEAAVEETFVNVNAASTLKLGQARAVALLVPALKSMPVAEYKPNLVKKTVVGAGHAAKGQIRMMVKTLLPGTDVLSEDAADALAVAICHAHHRGAPDLKTLKPSAMIGTGA